MCNVNTGTGIPRSFFWLMEYASVSVTLTFNIYLHHLSDLWVQIEIASFLFMCTRVDSIQREQSWGQVAESDAYEAKKLKW